VSPLEALIAGLLQGVLEWLPLSSEGLVSLTLTALGLSGVEALNLSIFLHLGTSIAALLYFLQTLYEDLEGDRGLLRLLLIASPLTLVMALPLYRVSRAAASLGPLFQLLVGFSLLSTGLLTRGARGGGERRRLSTLEAAALGLVQGLAVIPGISRSGITLSYLLLRGVEPSEAFRLAYLLGIPLGLAAPLGLLIVGEAPQPSPSLLLALLASLLAALLAIDLLLRAARGRRLWALCLLLGALTLSATALGWWS